MQESSDKIVWGEGFPWKDKTAFFTYLRGCLRSAWSKNPIKHDLVKKLRKRIPHPKPTPRRDTIWGFDCSMCGETFPISKVEVDHIRPAGKLNDVGDIQGFVERLLFVTESDLRLVCSGCNSALAYADRMGCTYEQAVSVKTAIALVKSKKDKQWLIDKGITPTTNQAKRREQIVEELNR